MANHLFSDFLPSDQSTWIHQVEKEIKKPISTLYQELRDREVMINPYISFEQFDPSQLEELAKAQKKSPGWLNMPTIHFKSIEITPQHIGRSLEQGAQAILLKAPSLSSLELTPIFTQKWNVPIFFETIQDPLELYKSIAATPLPIQGGIANDPIANWMRRADVFEPISENLIQLIRQSGAASGFYPVMIESHVFQEAGCNQIQELAYLLGNLTVYLDELTNAGVSPALAFQSVFLSVSVGTSYFPEMAKLRALRVLFQRIASAYGLAETQPFIHAKTSRFYQADSLPHTNLLRSTSAAMSAVIGGCDALTVLPFEGDGHLDFPQRIAQNTSSVMAFETTLGQVADPGAGSYYLESLTRHQVESAWRLFLDIESQGGMIACFENGWIQDEIDTSWRQKLNALKNGQTLVGVNHYRDSPVPDRVAFEPPTAKGLRPLVDRNLAQFWNTHQL